MDRLAPTARIFCLIFAATVSVSTHAATRMYFIHNDHLGTPVAVTDMEQTVVWRASRTPFGETDTTGTIDEHSRFPGQVFDEETGLSHNYFRDYDPSLGRYMQSDPIGLRGGLNTYAYVANNPLRYSDPRGLHPSLLPGMMSGDIPSDGLQMTMGVFGCGVGCVSFMNTDSQTQASLEATVGGGLTICFSPKNPHSSNNSTLNCGNESEGCGPYDPNCDNEISLPSLSPPGRFGYFLSGSKSQSGGYCLNIGPHIGLPLPSVYLGGLGE